MLTKPPVAVVVHSKNFKHLSQPAQCAIEFLSHPAAPCYISRISHSEIGYTKVCLALLTQLKDITSFYKPFALSDEIEQYVCIFNWHNFCILSEYTLPLGDASVSVLSAFQTVAADTPLSILIAFMIPSTAHPLSIETIICVIIHSLLNHLQRKSSPFL